MTDCSLCNPQLGPLLNESEHWRLVLNWNQDLLGKCFLATRRHVETLVALTPEEWADLQPQLQRVTSRLVTAFVPAHFNYAFLQNQDRHVHVHIIPRYRDDPLVLPWRPGEAPADPTELADISRSYFTD